MKRMRIGMMSLVAAMLLAVGGVRGQDAEPAAKELPFQSMEAGLRDAAENQRVAVVIFTAKWCGWCRTLEQTTLRNARVLAVAKMFTWIKVDVDDSPEYAAQFGVQGLPAMAFLNVRGEILGTQTGYVDGDRMLGTLLEYVSKAQDPGGMRNEIEMLQEAAVGLEKASTTGELDFAVKYMVQRIVAAQTIYRHWGEEALLERGKVIEPSLVRCLGEGQLTVRAAAYEMLVRLTGKTFAFDPFGDPEVREKQIVEIKKQIPDVPESSIPLAPGPELPGPVGPGDGGGRGVEM